MMIVNENNYDVKMMMIMIMMMSMMIVINYEDGDDTDNGDISYIFQNKIAVLYISSLYYHYQQCEDDVKE